MPVEISGFAQALVRCLDFQSVQAPELEDALADATATLEMSYAAPSADTPLIRSGAPFSHLLFVQHGVLAPWQFPTSELKAPFLIGEHELLMGAERWVASYSAATEAIVVEIPVSVMQLVIERIPRVRERMHELVMRRLSRFYWTSLAITGSPSSRVAAALASRLALRGDDYGTEQVVEVKQKDLVRLTTLSRSAVADGFSDLLESDVIRLGPDSGTRFAGIVVVPDVDRLKTSAFTDVREREIRGLIERLRRAEAPRSAP